MRRGFAGSCRALFLREHNREERGDVGDAREVDRMHGLDGGSCGGRIRQLMPKLQYSLA